MHNKKVKELVGYAAQGLLKKRHDINVLPTDRDPLETNRDKLARLIQIVPDSTVDALLVLSELSLSAQTKKINK